MAGPEIFDEILDSISYRFQPGARKAFNGGLSIQNVAGILCQVDDQGNVTPLLGGVLGGITNLTGDVTATGPGTVTATIGAKKVTYAKIQDVAANSFLGNASGSPASVTEISAASARTMLGLAAIATTGSAADLTSGTLPAGRFPALTGDVTTVAGSVATTVNIPANRIPFGDVSGHMTSSANLFYSNNGNLVVTTGVAGITGATDFGGPSILQALISDAGGANSRWSSGSNSPTANSALGLRRSRGTFASPSAVVAGDNVGQVLFSAYDGVGATIPTILFSQVPSDGTVAAGNVSMVAGFCGNFGATVNPGVSFGHGVLYMDSDQNVYVGSCGLTTTSTSGFLYVTATAGPPTGVPARVFGDTARAFNRVPIQIDTTVPAIVGYIGTSWVSLTGTGGGGGITALTGDVTASGSGSVVATIASNAVTTSKIAANAVTLAKLATQADQTILGNVSGGTAIPSALTASQVDRMLFGGLATGIVGVTTTTGALNSNVLTNTNVLYATGAGSIGQTNGFKFAATHNVLTVGTTTVAQDGSLLINSGSFGQSIGGGATAGIYVADPNGAGAASIAVDDYLFGQSVIGYSNLNMADLSIGAAAGHSLNLSYAMNRAGSHTDAVVIDGTTGAVSIATAVTATADFTVNGSLFSASANGGLQVDANANVLPGLASLAASATNGFPYVPRLAAKPTGAPNAFSGAVAFAVDIDTAGGHALYVRNPSGSQWEPIPMFISSATPAAGAASIANLPAGVGTTAKWWVFKDSTGTNTYIPYFQ